MNGAIWRLRRAGLDDVDGLHALASQPLVYRYLFDGAVPGKRFLADRVAEALEPVDGAGMWLLECAGARHAGCVQLRPDRADRTTELTYLLDPSCWGHGLAVRMAWTAITQAFASPGIAAVVAGADAPNEASFAVMRRLAMRFHRHVRYALGPGAEFILRRGDAGPNPRPQLLPII